MAWGWRCCVLAPARRHVDIDYIPSSFIFTYILSSPMVHTVDEQRNYCSSPQPAGSRTKCGPGVSPAPCLRLYIDLFNILSSILCVFYRLVFFSFLCWFRSRTARIISCLTIFANPTNTILLQAQPYHHFFLSFLFLYWESYPFSSVRCNWIFKKSFRLINEMVNWTFWGLIFEHDFRDSWFPLWRDIFTMIIIMHLPLNSGRVGGRIGPSSTHQIQGSPMLLCWKRWPNSQ